MTYFYCLSMHFVASHSIPIRGQNVDSYKYSSVDTKPYFVTLENFSLCSLVLVFQGNLLPFWIFCYPLLFLSGGWNAEMMFHTFFFFSTVLCYCNSIFCLLKCIADSYSLCYGRPTVSCLYMRTLFKFGNIFGMPIAHYLKIYIHQALYIHQAWTILTSFEYEERLLPAYRIFALHLKRKLGEGSENLFGFAEINCK